MRFVLSPVFPICHWILQWDASKEPIDVNVKGGPHNLDVLPQEIVATAHGAVQATNGERAVNVHINGLHPTRRLIQNTTKFAQRLPGIHFTGVIGGGEHDDTFAFDPERDEAHSDQPATLHN